MFWTSLRRNLALFALALVILVAGVVAIVNVAVDHVLYWDATTMAESWAQHVAENVADIEEIATGQTPSEESMRFFTRAQAIRYVFGFEIFDLDGKLQLTSEGDRVTIVGGTSRNAIAMSVAARKQPVVAVKRGEPPIRPANYSEAFVPVMVDGELRAVVASYIDLTEKNAQFHRIFALAGAALLVITVIAFAAPSIAWYRRTKDKQRADERIKFMAHHDSLTGLANRVHFLDNVQQSRARMCRDGTPFAVFMLDLDRFKRVNDSLGHAAGDLLLGEVARRLRTTIREADLLARLGGDEFAIIQSLPGDDGQRGDAPDDPRQASASLAGRVVAQFKQPFNLGGHSVFVGSSIGIALAPADASEPDDLLMKADLALYEAKTSGSNGYRFFEPRMMAVANERLQLEADLRGGLARGEFELHYQPIVDARTLDTVAMEALVRWRHPQHGLILPGRFIDVAEDSGLINPLGEWVLHQACRDAMSWPRHVAVAVNLSAVQVRQSALIDVVLGALVESGLPAERLELEVTETVLIGQDSDCIAMLHQLRNAGVSVALDDFGTGYSSLSYLKMFQFDKIKIDRSFTQEIGERADCAAIVCSIAGLGRSLGLATTAEGVETEQQLELVRAAGVTLAQGYLFGRPVPFAEVELESGSPLARPYENVPLPWSTVARGGARPSRAAPRNG
jgi:diguanylate cyclase (GGDEF)-like protein